MGRRRFSRPHDDEPQDPGMDPQAKEAMEEAEALVKKIEDELPDELKDQATEFFESVVERARGIAETIGRTGRVSAKQQEAISNMADAVAKWEERWEG